MLADLFSLDTPTTGARRRSCRSAFHGVHGRDLSRHDHGSATNALRDIRALQRLCRVGMSRQRGLKCRCRGIGGFEINKPDRQAFSKNRYVGVECPAFPAPELPIPAGLHGYLTSDEIIADVWTPDDLIDGHHNRVALVGHPIHRRRLQSADRSAKDKSGLGFAVLDFRHNALLKRSINLKAF